MSGDPHLTLLDPHYPNEAFPPLDRAWDEPNGLLAVGGDLSASRLVNAYSSGIFPWFNKDEPIYWWSPNPRAVLFFDRLVISRSLRKSARNKGYTYRIDSDFAATVKACSAPRCYSSDTWITDEMLSAYCGLHQMGIAHSVEVYNASGQLVGGLYGVVSRGVFSGESMFSIEPDTSKLALLVLVSHLSAWGYSLIDCQIANNHLMRLGTTNIARTRYLKILRSSPTPSEHHWQFDESIDISRWCATDSIILSSSRYL